MKNLGRTLVVLAFFLSVLPVVSLPVFATQCCQNSSNSCGGAKLSGGNCSATTVPVECYNCTVAPGDNCNSPATTCGSWNHSECWVLSGCGNGACHPFQNFCIGTCSNNRGDMIIDNCGGISCVPGGCGGVIAPTGAGGCTTVCTPAGCDPAGIYPCSCTLDCPSGGGGYSQGSYYAQGSYCGSYGPWSACSGSPATKTRTNDCGPQTTYCTGDIKVRAVSIGTSDTSCATIRAVPTTAADINNTSIGFTASSVSQPIPQIQSGADYVTFLNLVGGSYTVDTRPPSSDWVFQRACWTKASGTSGEGLSTYLSNPNDADTLTWDIGYSLGSPWFQTVGGDVYASGTIKSIVTGSVNPRQFTRNGTSGYPGIVTYGTDYDFDPTAFGKGETLVSSTNWLVNETYTNTDYYQVFYSRFGSPTTADVFPDLTAVTQPSPRATPYYVKGDMTTSGNWTIQDGDTVIFLVDGNLTINGKVNILGKGFVAFIVNGTITISSNVGTNDMTSSAAPVLEGVYVTSPTGSISTGTSSPGVERLVAKGTFVSGNFLLQRDLDSLGLNPSVAAELFIYNPGLLINMPDTMKDLPVTWSEVAP